MTRIAVPLAALIALAACSAGAPQDEGTNPAPSPTASSAPASPTAVAGTVPQPPDAPASPLPSVEETRGGDGSPIVLAALRPDDGTALAGELACSFTPADGGPAILIARANVGRGERSAALVRVGDVPERLVSVAEGGFGALERGTRLGGKGLTVEIVRGEPIAGGGESPAHAARLKAMRADGAERSYSGRWTCGP